MAKRPTDSASVPPSLTPYHAIELLRQRLSEFAGINALRRDDADVEEWLDTTAAILDGAFGMSNGEPHRMTYKFRYAWRPTSYNKSDEYYELEHHNEMLQKKAVLESCIEQLKTLARPAVAAGRYQFHEEIERLSGDLFRDGHYKQAALEAYTRVIDEVRHCSGLALDGDKLMNHAFGCENGIPVLKFNSLSTEAERDEQQGFLYLFKGVVGFSNSKAHSDRLFDDPSRAHEYLALASLLLRVLELAS